MKNFIAFTVCAVLVFSCYCDPPISSLFKINNLIFGADMVSLVNYQGSGLNGCLEGRSYNNEADLLVSIINSFANPSPSTKTANLSKWSNPVVQGLVNFWVEFSTEMEPETVGCLLGMGEIVQIFENIGVYYDECEEIFDENMMDLETEEVIDDEVQGFQQYWNSGDYYTAGMNAGNIIATAFTPKNSTFDHF